MLKPHRRAEVGFEYTQEIGQHGQNSRTYLARDHQLDAEIVIKEITKVKLDADRFFSEAQALYASAHPNVVQIHYACQDDENVYVAMPLYRCGSLKDLLARQFMTVREIVTIGCQVLAGLQHVHSKRLVHFDVKPDNVLLSERGEGLLSDFGLARPIGPRGLAELDQMYVRTQPPEGFRGYEFPRTFDIYQVGVLLYRMACGNEEFDRQFSDRNRFPAHIPSRMRTVIKKCLQTDPNERYSSALEVANALAPIDGDALDWRHSKPVGCQRWEKNVEGTLYEFELAEAGGTTCYKTKGAGQRRRIGEGCAAAMTDRQLRTFLGDH
jgi:serine/threonine protein kinase